MKLCLLAALVFAACAVEARADVVYSITNSVQSTLTSSSSITAQADRNWHFDLLPGWDPTFTFVSMTVSETFSVLSSAKQFQATIINFDTAPVTSALEIFFLQPQQATNASLTRTFTIGCCTDVNNDNFTLADITGDGVLGEFKTRVALDAGSPLTLTGMTISLDFLTPEPATFGMIGLGLAGLALIARRRNPRG